MVLYSDGVIERRRESIDDGLRRLAATAIVNRHRPLAELCDELMAMSAATPTTTDDDSIALCAQFSAPVPPGVPTRT